MPDLRKQDVAFAPLWPGQRGALALPELKTGLARVGARVERALP